MINRSAPAASTALLSDQRRPAARSVRSDPQGVMVTSAADARQLTSFVSLTAFASSAQAKQSTTSEVPLLRILQFFRQMKSTLSL